MRRLGMPIHSPKDWLSQLQASQHVHGPVDIYNQGDKLIELEKRVAVLLNKPASLFFTKGTSAQLCALKVASEQRNSSHVAIHTMSHIAHDEEDAYQALMGLNGILIGKGDRPFDMKDVGAINKTLAALSVELPLRRAGFKLTQWEALVEMSHWCKTQQVHFHMDGARLWESSCAYQKSEAEISGLFDSVYVSLYKGLGSVGGAILAGENEFIEACKVWRARLGGNAFTSFPMVIGALDGLDNRLQRIPEWVARAKQIAQQLTQFPRLIVDTPQTNGFFVFIEGNIDALSAKADYLNQQMDLTLFSQFTALPEPHKHMIEIQVGADHNAISDQEIIDYFALLLA